MRIIFMGSPAFAVPTLDAILAAGHDVVAVYSQPPRPAGRGKTLQPTAVAARAAALGLPVHTPTSLRDAAEQARFASLKADIAVVAAYGLILPQPILDAPRRGCVNVHASLLPRWRGAAPVQRAIMAGDTHTGVTIMQMEAGLDTGPMLLRADLPIGAQDSAALTEALGIIGAELMTRYLAEPDAFPAVAQPADGVSYARKVTKDEARIDFAEPASRVARQVQGLAPFPGAWFGLGDERIKLLAADVVAGQGAPGTVLDDQLSIACGSGAIRPTLLQRAGKGAMTTAELLRGFPVPAGSRLA